MTLKIHFSDPTLFGNDVAEDENEDVFQSYAVERPEVAEFVNADNNICIAHAYKGEGKSALLRLARKRLSDGATQPIIVARTALNVAPDVDSLDYGKWVRGWKTRILSSLAAEIGSQIGAAWNDDAISLVEEAERIGFKQKNFVSAVLKRLIPSVQIKGVSIKFPEGSPFVDAEPILRRWLDGSGPLWLFIDDIDKNFDDTEINRLRVASFFDAARELMLALPELRIRASVRPNVWATLKMKYESLSHVEQYLYDLNWSEEQIRALLASRVRGYLQRTKQWNTARKSLPPNGSDQEYALIELVFHSPMPWGAQGRTRPPHVVLYTLSKHRPRWLVELAKIGAKSAARARHSRITVDDITSMMDEFGQRRIADTIAEFSAQCPQVDELITAFSRQPEEMATDELFRVIENRILTQLSPRISGIMGKATSRQVASFLFQIGFFYGRRDGADGYEHITFAQRPTLFLSRTAVDAGLKWEIHPVFRQALEMRDSSGQEIRRRL
jgi:hypothetical protein